MNTEKYATEVVKRLAREGYIAYFAGGWVRDYLMGHPSDDIDIATNAPPEKILDLFPQTILVGLSFGVVVVQMDGHQYDVATFRRDIDYVDGRKPTLIELATPEEDAARRDFTINGMFYDPLEDVIHDFVQGQEDIALGVIRTIGDPYDRFSEDRLRMVRAIRFAARFGFTIDEETKEAICAYADTLFPAVAMERIWQEFTKMAKYQHFDKALIELHRHELLPIIFPELKGVHLNEIKSRVAHFKDVPGSMEPTLALMELFPAIEPLGANELCRYLRMSVHQMKLANYFITLKKLVAKEGEGVLPDKVLWAHTYANPHLELCLKMMGAKLAEPERLLFVTTHQERQSALKAHVERIVNKKPLLNATFLAEQGVVPGRLMGQLMKEAEAITILHDLSDPLEVLSRLKKEPLWTTKN